MHAAHIAVVVVIAIGLRSMVALHPYSGQGKPPMFGDYEAQRHWMEVTYNLPVKQWYENGTDNDLMYWGLDYPPLTAYHSWVCGSLMHRINTSWVELFKSRGLESYDHKVFMRYSVLVADLLVYIPAILIYFLKCTDYTDLTSNGKVVLSLLCLIYPGLVLIDHGHFQYNCISLGFAVWGVIGLCSGYDVLGSAAFVLALNYKQMELYHAMPFFCYLAGKCVTQWKEKGFMSGLWKLIKLTLVVIAVFFACWKPFLLLDDKNVALQVLRRLFPFSRGLYEDKVSNFWCAFSVVVKLKLILTVENLIKLCSVTTLVALIPTSVDLFLRPTLTKFKYSLINSSLIFFLFSFQVHEKTILLAAIPVCLMMPHDILTSIWFLTVSTFSMLPLLIKDKLVIAFVTSVILFYLMADILVDQLKLVERQSLVCNEIPSSQSRKKNSTTIQATVMLEPHTMHSNSLLLSCSFGISVMGMMILTVATLTVTPPAGLPDLFPLLVSVYSCAHFLLFLLYFHWKQFSSTEQRHSSKPLDYSDFSVKNSKSDKLKKKIKHH